MTEAEVQFQGCADHRLRTHSAAELSLGQALLASGQITMRRVDGWQPLESSPTNLDLAA